VVPVPFPSMRYWEDFQVGEVAELGPVAVSEDEIVEFARRFDPQPFHVDPEAARESPFGGLIASGWHTAAIYMGMFVRGVLEGTASLGSPGVEELRWLAPVRPGDTLRGRTTITDLQPSSTSPGRGTIFGSHEVLNQDDVVVMRFRSRGFIARRP
jgi:acyl dehydratase